MKRYAEINAEGVCVAELETATTITAANMIEVSGPLGAFLRKRWTGTAWQTVAPTEAELAAAELVQVDQATGMSRTMREAFLAIAGKVGADVTYLAAQEAKAAAARAKIPKP